MTTHSIQVFTDLSCLYTSTASILLTHLCTKKKKKNHAKNETITNIIECAKKTLQTLSKDIRKTLKLHVRSWFKHSNFPEKGLVSSHGSKPQLVKSATRDQL